MLDDRFATVVAFLEGAMLANPENPLSDFQEWVAERILQRHSPRHWAYIIAEVCMPEIASGKLSLNEMPMDIQQLLVADAVDLIREYSTSRGNQAASPGRS